MTTLPVAPIGTYHEVRDWPIYSPSPLGQGLHTLREAAGLSLEDAAARLEITADELCDLERGRRPFATAEEWAEAQRRIAEGLAGAELPEESRP